MEQIRDEFPEDEQNDPMEKPPDETDDPEFRKKAFEYVTQWLSASKRYIEKKKDKWALLEDLYHNRRDLNSWGKAASDVLGAGFDKSAGSGGSRKWRSDIILAPSYIVDSWADRSYQSIFSGPEWLSVIPENPDQVISDGQFPSSYKLQELLLSRLAQGQIHMRLYEILQHLVLYGTVYAKVYWYSKEVSRHKWDFLTMEAVATDETIFDCPVVQVIPLDRLLVDWTATHSDVQRHSGIGHQVDQTYEHIITQFERGVYNLNEDEFRARWTGDSQHGGAQEGGLLRDEDATGIESERDLAFTIWEWHGRISTENGPRECLCTIVTERGADSPEDGVMVRLNTSPVLWSGLRPFVAAHYTPMPGPFGMGAIESNLDLIHAISQFISQSQDNARLTANAQLVVRRGSSAARQINSESDVVYPGKVWTVDDPADIQPFPTLSFPQGDINNIINYLNGILEKRTTVSETTLGVEGSSKTATEAHILNQSAMTPFATRADLFARSFLEPLGKLALSMLQQFLVDDQVITVRDGGGLDRSVRIPVEEIQAGNYKVVATMTQQDSTRIAKAQSIERVLPTLANFREILMEEGVRISFTELLKRYLDLIGVDGANRVFVRMGLDHGGETYPMEGDPNLHAEDSINARDIDNMNPMGRAPTDSNILAGRLQKEAGQSPALRSDLTQRPPV
jgi:hypothetical protein